MYVPGIFCNPYVRTNECIGVYVPCISMYVPCSSMYVLCMYWYVCSNMYEATYHHGSMVVANVVDRDENAFAILLTSCVIQIALKFNSIFIIFNCICEHYIM